MSFCLLLERVDPSKIENKEKLNLKWLAVHHAKPLMEPLCSPAPVRNIAGALDAPLLVLPSYPSPLYHPKYIVDRCCCCHSLFCQSLQMFDSSKPPVCHGCGIRAFSIFCQRHLSRKWRGDPCSSSPWFQSLVSSINDRRGWEGIVNDLSWQSWSNIRRKKPSNLPWIRLVHMQSFDSVDPSVHIRWSTFRIVR